jgi:hypothetical protein
MRLTLSIPALALCGCRALLGIGDDPVDDDPDDRDGPITSSPVASGPFVPLVCTGGMPGDPSCPINLVPLPVENTAKFEFIAVSEMGAGFTLLDMRLRTAERGIFLAHPRLLGYPPGSQQPLPDPADPYAAIAGDLQANRALALPGSATVPEGTADRIGIQFDMLRPL